jgi:hypothetical protein
MDQVLTVEEIKTRYDSEWVLLGDPDVSASREVLGGKLLFHSKDRDEVYRKLGELRPGKSAILYTGPQVPEGTAIIL